MNWKHAGAILLFLILGLLIIGGLTLSYFSILSPLFAIAYFLTLVIYALHPSSLNRNILIALLVIYFLLIIIPFPTCSSWGKFGGESKDCTCIGFEKHSVMVFDAYWSQCVGIPTKYTCTQYNRQTNEREVVSCTAN